MFQDVSKIRRTLRSTALSGAMALLLTPALALAFNPDTGDDTLAPARKSTTLPSTAPLIAPTSSSYALPPASSAAAAAAAPVYSAPLEFAPIVKLSPVAAAAVPVANAPVAYAQPAPSVAATAPAPLLAPIVYTPAPTAPAVAATRQFPPVDPAVVAQAQREMAAPAPQPSVIAAPPNFVAPAPLAAAAPVAPPVAVVPVVASAPVIVHPATVVVAQPATITAVPPVQPVVASAATVPASVPAMAGPGLSDSTRAILHRLPTKIDTPKPVTGGKLDMQRMSPTVKPMGSTKGKVESYDAVGLSIKVARPGIDTNFELNRAYDALMAGDTTTAIETYKNVLANDPQNQDALFGIASTYHRQGDLIKARPYYAELLKVNPTHREGLNNFLALASEESPNEALAELERLEQQNPDFSPIPAQESILLSKFGYYEQARDKLMRAIELAPDNMTYRYNLAVMFDRHGDTAEAMALYRMLINASLNGEKLPATTEVLQKRLNYISAAATTANAPGN